MTDCENIEYTIVDKQQYGPDIDNIMQKNTNKKWMSEDPTDQLLIKLRLKEPSYVSRLEVRPVIADSIELVFKDFDDESVGSTKFTFDQSKDTVTLTRNIQLNRAVISVDLILKSNNYPKKLGMNFVLLKGSKQSHGPSKEKFSNLTKEQTIGKVPLSVVQPIQKQKSKPISVSRPYTNYFDRNLFNQREKRNQPRPNYKEPESFQVRSRKEEEDTQLLRAMKESEKQYQREQNKKNLLEKETVASFEDNSDTVPLEPERNYQVAPLQDMLECLKFVNHRWLEAQRRAEEELGVKEQERLSKYIQIKYLLGKKVFIDGTISGQKRSRLETTAEGLGAKLIGSPGDYCFIISTSFDSETVKKAIAKYNGIKAVNENYLIDCRKHEAELDWKDYSLK